MTFALHITKVSGGVGKTPSLLPSIEEVNHRATMRGGGSNFDNGKMQFTIYAKPDSFNVHDDKDKTGYIAFSHTLDGAERLRRAWIEARIKTCKEQAEAAQYEADKWVAILAELEGKQS